MGLSGRNPIVSQDDLCSYIWDDTLCFSYKNNLTHPLCSVDIVSAKNISISTRLAFMHNYLLVHLKM